MDAFYDLLDKAKRKLIYCGGGIAATLPSLVENAELVLRPMERADLKTIAEIDKAAYEFPWEYETFRDCFKIGYHCWVGERARTIVGYGIATVGAGEAHIVNLCVSPNSQGKGYGRLLLQRLVEDAARFKATSIFLEVRPSNPNAIKLYHSMGFNEIGCRKDYYPARSGREDAIVMALEL